MVDLEYQAFPCQDGYICGTGSSTAQGTQECPRDHYCVAGALIPCPPGFYSTITGLTQAAECAACPPGKICPNKSEGIYKCPEG
jgi:hypothetical protein